MTTKRPVMGQYVVCETRTRSSRAVSRLSIWVGSYAEAGTAFHRAASHGCRRVPGDGTDCSNPYRPATSSLANWLGINWGRSETPLNAALCDRALDCSSRQNRPKPVSEPFRLTTSGLCRGEVQRFPGSLSTLVRIQAGPVLQVLPTGSPAHPVIPAGDVLRRSRRDFAALMPSCRLLWVYPPLAP